MEQKNENRLWGSRFFPF